jgi:hypothetical protein
MGAALPEGAGETHFISDWERKEVNIVIKPL